FGPGRAIVRVHAAAVRHHRVVTAQNDVQIPLRVDRDRRPGMIVDARPERDGLRPLAGRPIERANAIDVALLARLLGILPDNMRLAVVRDDVIAWPGGGTLA